MPANFSDNQLLDQIARNTGGLPGNGFPGSLSRNTPQNYGTAWVIKTSPGKLFKLNGYNSGGAQFLHLFDATGVPGNGAIPILPIALAATSNFDINFQDLGLPFFNGITICVSTTATTLTLGSANVWVLATFF